MQQPLNWLATNSTKNATALPMHAWLVCLIQISMPATTSLSIILANQALNAADAEVTAEPPFPVAAGGLRPPAFIIQHNGDHAA